MKLSLLAIFSLLALPVFATEYAAPEAKEIYSENGDFYVNVSATSETHEVRAKGGKEALWKFKYSPWHDEIFVSDDGSRVVIVMWKHCKAEDSKSAAIRIINRDKTENAYSYEQLCTPRKRGDREVGPIGDFWRIWKERPSTVKDQMLKVEAAGGKTIVINLKTGEIVSPLKSAPEKSN